MIILPDFNNLRQSIEKSEQHQACLPFKVQLAVFLREGADPIMETIFVRCPKPDSAGNLAYYYGKKWLLQDRGMPVEEKFPCIKGSGQVIVMDNSDWNAYLKEATSLMRRQARGQDGEHVCFFSAVERQGVPPVAWCLRGVNFDASGFDPKIQKSEGKVEIELPI